jgi:fumarate hydratase subunit alpha
MREIAAHTITESIALGCIEVCTQLPMDVYEALCGARKTESDPTAENVLGQLIENANIARDEHVPICQDTGLMVVFVDIGQEVHITDGYLVDAINAGVRKGYSEGYLRKSIVAHPLARVNTNDNTPAVIHTSIIPGDSLTIWLVPKGGGCENMSVAKVLKPSDGADGVVKFVVDTVIQGGPNPCPPIIVGVGLGGTLEQAAILSKRAILRTIGSVNPVDIDANLETRLLAEVNKTSVGPSGYGGDTTALAVHVESYPCHIASLPVAITIQCHAARHKVIEFFKQ